MGILAVMPWKGSTAFTNQITLLFKAYIQAYLKEIKLKPESCSLALIDGSNIYIIWYPH